MYSELQTTPTFYFYTPRFCCGLDLIDPKLLACILLEDLNWDFVLKGGCFGYNLSTMHSLDGSQQKKYYKGERKLQDFS